MLNYSNPVDFLDASESAKFEQNKTLYPYRLSIQNVANLKYILNEEEKKTEKRFFIKFLCSFYYENKEFKNEKISLENKQFFFGNTYETQKIKANIEPNGTINFEDGREINDVQMFFFNN